MKKLMIYFAVIVGCLFVGLTTYYLLKDYDVFTINQNGAAVSAENDYYLNKGQSITLEINIDKKSDDTEVQYSFDTDGVASFDKNTGKITALKGGSTKLKIFTNKDTLGFYEFNISVADGSKDYGWYIFNVADLKSIGTTRSFEGNEDVYEWKYSDSYQLMNDIDLNNNSWAPLGLTEEINTYAGVSYLEGETKDFKGEFNGNGHKIKNLKIEGTHLFAGFFASMADSALFTNVVFENVDIQGYFLYAGTVAGYSEGSTIQKVEVVNGNIKLLKSSLANGVKTPYDVNFVGGILGGGSTKPGEEVVATNSINLCTFEGTIEIASDAAATTMFQIGGICGSGYSVELMNNKSTLNLKIKNYIQTANPTQINSFGGIVGTSFCDDIDFSKTFDEQTIFYPIISNNLSILSYDAVNGKMNGTLGQRAIKSVTDAKTAAYLQANPDKTAEVNDLIYQVNQLIQVRITGNIFVLKTEEVGALPFKGQNENEPVNYYAGTFKYSEVDLKNISTFKNDEKGIIWSISEPSQNQTTAWIIEGENIPTINLDGLNDTTDLTQKYIEIKNVNDFQKYVNLMLNSTNSVAKYWLSREYKLMCDIDLAQTSFKDAWTPIYGKTNNYVFTGVFDGNGHTISNVKIVNTTSEKDGKTVYAYDTAGLFAVVSKTAVVKNLKVKNIDINYADYAGAIAGINSGKILNVQVEGVHIADAKTAGLIVGHNDGLIETTNKDENDKLVYTVLQDTEKTNKIDSSITNKSVFLGGAVGYNTGNGKIIGVKLEQLFELNGAKAYNSAVVKMLGGIAGYNGGLIENCAVEGASIKDSSTVFTYLGGIAGLTNGTIKNCLVGVPGGVSTSILGNVEKNNIIIGGIAGQISAGASVEKCFVGADLKGYYIGGVAANLFGTVKECYITGPFEGTIVGGISVNVSISDDQEVGGNVENCYVGATLKGYTADAKLAGLSVYIVKPGKFNKVIVSAIFTGEGEKYYESYTDTRKSFFNWFKKISGTKLGHVYNIVIDNSINDGAVQANGGAIEFEGQSAYYVDTATLQSGENFYKDKGFNVSDEGEWLMEPPQSPKLRAINLNVVEEDEAEELEAIED